MAMHSKGFGSVTIDPRATADLPDTYEGLVAAIAAEEAWLAAPPPQGSKPYDRVTHALYLERLKRRQRDYDAAVSAHERTKADAEARELHEAAVAERAAEMYGGA